MNDLERHDLDEPESRPPFDLKVLLLYGVARHRGFVLASVAVGTFLGLLVGASQPNTYTASAKLRFQPSARQLLTDESVFGIDSDDPFRARNAPGVEDELELLRDPVIYERAVERIGAREILRVEDPAAGADSRWPSRGMHLLQSFLIRAKGLDDPCPEGAEPGPLCRRAAVEALMDATTLAPIKRTSILDVRFQATSPTKARRVTEVLLEEFVRRHLEEYEAQKHLSTHVRQVEDAFQDLQEKAKRFNEYREQSGFYDIALEREAVAEDLARIERNLQAEEIELKRLRATIAQYESELNNLGGEGSSLTGAPVNNPAFQALYQERLQLKMSLSELEAKERLSVTETRSLARDRERLQTVEQLIRDASDIASGDLGLDLAAANPAVAQAQIALTDARAQLAGLVDQMDAERETLERLRERRDRIFACEDQHLWHQAQLDQARARFTGLTARTPQLDTLATMDAEGRSNLSVFRAPRTPADKDGPQRTRPLGLGVFFGLGIGVGVAALRQLLDRRVRYRETLARDLGLKVLCVVPDVAGLDDTGRRAA